MQIDPASHSGADNYKLLTNIVIPRPIAWITTQDQGGVVNLAPFSFFNAVAGNPLYVIVSIDKNDSGGLKDTARNIVANREFVVNMVTEELFDAMNISAADFPPGQSELEAVGLNTADSVQINTPRLAEATASMECRLHSTQKLGSNTLVIGEVVMFHIADHLIDERVHVNGYAPIGRLGSPSVYCRTTDRFDVARISYAQGLESNGSVTD
ncbi:MAG: flavin reductase family protein [Pseudolabrys sp.]